MARTKAEFYQEIVSMYRDAGEEWPASTKMLAAWAYRRKLCEPPRRNVIDMIASDFADAMREEFTTDPQGRRVRTKHAVRELRELPDGTHEQLVFWVDINDATPQQMQLAFQQRRMQVLGDCRHLKTDVDSYNDNNRNGARIQMVFDFTDDLAELEQSAEFDLTEAG